MTLLTKLFQRFFGLGEADTAEMRKSENDLKEVLDYYDRVLASQRYRKYHWLTCSISHGFTFFPALGSKTKSCLERMSQSGVNDWSSERRGAKSCRRSLLDRFGNCPWLSVIIVFVVQRTFLFRTRTHSARWRDVATPEMHILE